jgi:hypothetical protein
MRRATAVDLGRPDPDIAVPGGPEYFFDQEFAGEGPLDGVSEPM